MNLEWQINDPDGAIKKLQTFPGELQIKGARFALLKAANLVRDAAKAKAATMDDPKTSADIAKNLVVRWSKKKFKRTGDSMYRVGVMGGASVRTGEAAKRMKAERQSLPGKDTRHWRHIEFGTEHIQARPFMRPALAENTGKATDEFVRHLGRWIDRQLKKAGR